ncbi:MAG: VCBS repeat-containing protein [Cytophagales bacterium]|nr:VCBS repeat-containing protein [Cytophagales bacterium]
MEVFSVSRYSATPQEVLTIAGVGFSDDPAELSVDFSGVLGQIVASSPYYIQVKVPSGAQFGRIGVLNKAKNQWAYSRGKFMLSFSGGDLDMGRFSATTTFAAGANLSDLAAADLDLDGNIDLVGSNTGGNTMTVFRNTSTISIGFDRTNVAVGFPSSNINVGDLDGDGKPEVVVSKLGSNGELAILSNTGEVGRDRFGSYAQG